MHYFAVPISHSVYEQTYSFSSMTSLSGVLENPKTVFLNCACHTIRFVDLAYFCICNAFYRIFNMQPRITLSSLSQFITNRFLDQPTLAYVLVSHILGMQVAAYNFKHIYRQEPALSSIADLHCVPHSLNLSMLAGRRGGESHWQTRLDVIQ